MGRGLLSRIVIASLHGAIETVDRGQQLLKILVVSRVGINGGIVISFPLIFQPVGPRGRISTCGSSGRSVDGFREVTLQEAPWCMGLSISLERKLGGCGMASSGSSRMGDGH